MTDILMPHIGWRMVHVTNFIVLAVRELICENFPSHCQSYIYVQGRNCESMNDVSRHLSPASNLAFFLGCPLVAVALTGPVAVAYGHVVNFVLAGCSRIDM